MVCTLGKSEILAGNRFPIRDSKIILHVNLALTTPVFSAHQIDTTLAESLTDFLNEQPSTAIDVMELDGDVAAGSTIGHVRKENQDRYLVARYSHPDSLKSFEVAALADGVGSLAESGKSAALAISAFVSGLVAVVERYSVEALRSEWENALRGAIQQANRFVFSYTGDRGASTLSAVVVTQFQAPALVHVGDSKVYGANSDFRLKQLSVDQTVGSHLQSLGLPHGSDAGRDARFERALAQYLGMPDLIQPQVSRLDSSWEMLVLATDGIAAARLMLDENGWKQMFKNARSRGDFIRKALFLSNWLGGSDNSTMLIVPSRSLAGTEKAIRGGVLRGMASNRVIEFITRATPAPIVPPRPMASTPTPVLPLTATERKRHKGGGKHRKTKLSRGQMAKSPKPDQKPTEKTQPSITFLPGLKDENASNEHSEKI